MVVLYWPALNNVAGQVSAQRAVLRVKQAQTPRNKASVDAFIEEVVVRRELAENFCHYNQHYDSIEGAPQWAQHTLRVHKTDKREWVYSETEFEEAKTHDPLWNAAQVRIHHAFTLLAHKRCVGSLSLSLPLHTLVCVCMSATHIHTYCGSDTLELASIYIHNAD